MGGNYGVISCDSLPKFLYSLELTFNVAITSRGSRLFVDKNTENGG